SGLVLSACTFGSHPGRSLGQPATAPPSFAWGFDQAFSAYNANTAEADMPGNLAVLQQVLRGFWYYAPNGALIPDTEYGTYQKLSDNPLTVRYTFNPKATWSDGVPMGCADAVLTWLANSGVTGSNGFSAASTDGYRNMTKPKCAAGDKSFTVVYKKPFADWDSMFGSPQILPAHVLQTAAGVPDLITAADRPNSFQVLQAATAYNTIWRLTRGPIRPAMMPSDGPYTITAWDPGRSLTLTANHRWWGKPPRSSTLVVRYLADDVQLQALLAGDINAMDPQPQLAMVTRLKTAAGRVRYSIGDSSTFEHLDFNFGGVFKDRNLRLAFAKCVPRQQIVNSLIKPVNPNATVLDSRFVLPFQPAYPGFIAGNGGQPYDRLDIGGGKNLVSASGQKQPITVRLGWLKDPQMLNTRRVDTLAMVRDSCRRAGFNVVDAGSADFYRKGLPNSQFDVAMFGWDSSPRVTAADDVYMTKGDSNFGRFSDPQIDKLFAQLSVETDKTRQAALLKQIDTRLWADLATIPLFAVPGMLGTTPSAQGIAYNATQQNLTWNAYDWTVAP
ncbi:MAG TPA: ABC transporter family substrate-binding protein, partial [Streptosporangiaceae bacterium]|nr:ABC transporter family substrate-binding protein [Streptosporangiaceae bacterium]